MNRFQSLWASRLAALFLGAAAPLLCAAALPGRAVAQSPIEDPMEEIKRLFRQVEKDLQEIDKLLLDAAREPKGAPKPAAKPEGPATPQESAKSAHVKQKDVSEAIQKILDLIPEGSGSCSSKECSNHGLKKPGESSSGQGNSEPRNAGGDKKQPRPGSPTPTGEDEKTAQGAGQAPTEPKSAKPSGGTPENNQRSSEPPSQGKAKPRDYDTARVQRGKETVERWGDLPEHTRKVFENTSTDDLPLRYRKWIQDFYTRVLRPVTAR
jgi:hypothetical protein